MEIKSDNRKEYIKFASGLLICFGVVEFPATAVGVQTASYTYPVPFIERPITIACWRDNTPLLQYFGYLIVYIGTNGSSNSNLVLAAKRSIEEYDWYAFYVSIGKWK